MREFYPCSPSPFRPKLFAVALKERRQMKKSLNVRVRVREYALAKFLILAGLAALIPLPAAATERSCYGRYDSYAYASSVCRSYLDQGICLRDPEPPPSDGIIVSIEGRNGGWYCCCVSLL